MIPLGRMTGQAERAVRGQQGDGRGSMASVAAAVRGRNILGVGRLELIAGVAGRAGSVGGMVISMTIPASARGRRQGESHRLRVALGAAELSVSLVLETHWPAARCAVADRNRDRQRQAVPALVRRVAGGAVGL